MFFWNSSYNSPSHYVLTSSTYSVLQLLVIVNIYSSFRWASAIKFDQTKLKINGQQTYNFILNHCISLSSLFSCSFFSFYFFFYFIFSCSSSIFNNHFKTTQLEVQLAWYLGVSIVREFNYVCNYYHSAFKVYSRQR